MNISPTASYKFVVYAGYHQFYLEDENATGSTGSSDFWTKEAHDRMLATNPGIIGVGTASYGDVPITVEIYDRQPLDDAGEWNHIAEASLELSSGQLLVCGCPDPEEVGRITLVPGLYRVRVHYGGLETVEDEQGDDYYKIAIWLESVTS